MKALEFRPKLFDTLKSYNKQQLSADLMAGIIVGIVALPLAIAFGRATTSNNSPPTSWRASSWAS